MVNVHSFTRITWLACGDIWRHTLKIANAFHGLTKNARTAQHQRWTVARTHTRELGNRWNCVNWNFVETELCLMCVFTALYNRRHCHKTLVGRRSENRFNGCVLWARFSAKRETQTHVCLPKLKKLCVRAKYLNAIAIAMFMPSHSVYIFPARFFFNSMKYLLFTQSFNNNKNNFQQKTRFFCFFAFGRCIHLLSLSLKPLLFRIKNNNNCSTRARKKKLPFLSLGRKKINASSHSSNRRLSNIHSDSRNKKTFKFDFLYRMLVRDLWVEAKCAMNAANANTKWYSWIKNLIVHCSGGVVVAV